MSKLTDESSFRFEAPTSYPVGEKLLAALEHACNSSIGFRVADAPLILPYELLESMANAGAEMALSLIGDQAYLGTVRAAIPETFRTPGETAHPAFLSADFVLAQDAEGSFSPRLVDLRAFPSAYAGQAVLCEVYRRILSLDADLGVYLGGLDESSFWTLLTRTVMGTHDPAHVVLAAVDPTHHPSRADFQATARRLGVTVADPRTFVAIDNQLHYRGNAGQAVPIHRIYNRLSAEELSAGETELPFDPTYPWDVEWANHPHWEWLIGGSSLARFEPAEWAAPAVFLDEFFEGPGQARLEAAGVPGPTSGGPDTAYGELVLKPAMPAGGRTVQFEPARGQLEAILPARRRDFLLQQRIHAASAFDTQQGPACAELRILYLWPDDGLLTPVFPSVRLRTGGQIAAGPGQRPCGDGEAGTLVSAVFYHRKQETIGQPSSY